MCFLSNKFQNKLSIIKTGFNFRFSDLSFNKFLVMGSIFINFYFVQSIRTNVYICMPNKENKIIGCRLKLIK